MVSKQYKRTRIYGLYKMGLLETYRFIIVGDPTYVFHMPKGPLSQVGTKWDQ